MSAISDSTAAPATGMASMVDTALVVYVLCKDEPSTPAGSVPPGTYTYNSLQPLVGDAVEASDCIRGYSRAQICGGALYWAKEPEEPPTGPIGQRLKPKPLVEIIELNGTHCLLLDLRGQEPAAAGAGDVASLIPRLKSVSFQPVSSFSAVCYEDLDNAYELQRPKDYGHFISLLQSAKIYDSAVHGLSYFINDKIEPWAANRIRLTEDSFADWVALESTFARLPRVVVYPRVDGVSPDKGPSRPDLGSPDGASTTTPSTLRLFRQEEFKTSLRQIDGEALKKCLIPTCNISFAKSFSQSQAAHILCYSILDVPKKHPFYKAILSEAGFLRADIDHARNGMLLCAGHHATFDTYQWTVDPTTSSLVVRPDADDDQQVLNGKKLDFSHRSEPHWRPTQKVWAAYNKHIYSDKGVALRAAARKGSAVAGDAAASSASVGSSGTP